MWALLDAGEPRLAAAMPFYGPAPASPDFAGNRAAVLGVYAELDARVNASRETAQAALEAAGLEHEIKTYPGVDQAFFNDTGQRYNAEQAPGVYGRARVAAPIRRLAEAVRPSTIPNHEVRQERSPDVRFAIPKNPTWEEFP